MKTVKCRNYGLDYPHKDSKCPAEGKTCNFCMKKIILQVYIEKTGRSGTVVVLRAVKKAVTERLKTINLDFLV